MAGAMLGISYMPRSSVMTVCTFLCGVNPIKVTILIKADLCPANRLPCLIADRAIEGRTAEFRFFSSSVRSGDTPGQILPDAERDLDDAGLLEVAIPALDVPVGQVVPVRVSPVVTELGILELWMEDTPTLIADGRLSSRSARNRGADRLWR